MEPKRIKSTTNPLVKAAIRVRKGHSTFKGLEFFIEGAHLLETALASRRFKLTQAFVADAFAARHENDDLMHQLFRHLGESRVCTVSDDVMAKLSDTASPQGIVALATGDSLSLADLQVGHPPLFVVSDGIQDPGNMGALLRLADAVGADALVVLPGSCNPFMPKAIRSSVGSIFHIPVVHAEVVDFLGYVAARSIPLVGADARAETSCFDADLRGPLAVVFGNEACGLGERISQKASFMVRVPIIGKTESLNVATSAAVILYEALRQRAVAARC